MKLYYVAVAILIAMLVYSCTNRDNSAVSHETIVENVELEGEKTGEKKKEFSTTDAATDSSANAAPVLNAGNPGGSPGWDKKIIKTADVALELKDYASYDRSIHNSIKSYGAYIAGEQQVQGDDRIGNSVTIKVPVNKFEDLTNLFSGEGIKVIERRISTQDVTGEVVDTKARIEAKKEIRERYLGLLKQAKNMKEILEVQKEINSVQEDLESADGRVTSLVHQSAYSTINLSYYQYIGGGTSAEPTFFTRLCEAFTTGSSIVAGFLLFLVTIWPVVVTAAIVLALVKKYQLKKLALKKEA